MAFRRRVTGGRGRAAPDNAPASAEKWSLYAAEYDGMVCPPGGGDAAGRFENPGRDAFRLLGDRDRPVADGACFSACAEKGIRGGDSASADRAFVHIFSGLLAKGMDTFLSLSTGQIRIMIDLTAGLISCLLLGLASRGIPDRRTRNGLFWCCAGFVVILTLVLVTNTLTAIVHG